jgi:hypothetical protein
VLGIRRMFISYLLDVPKLLVGLVVFAAIPLVPYLTVLALKEWRKQGQGNFPGWRSFLGFVSILSTFLCWLVYVASFSLLILVRISLDSNLWLTIEILTLVLGILSAFALKSPSRAQTLSAGLFLIILLAATVNF